MAVNNVKNNVQAVMDTLMTQGPASYELTQQVETARTMLEQQRLAADPVLLRDECIGWEVNWLNSGDDALYFNGTGAEEGEDSLVLACDLPTGKQANDTAVTYTDNVRIISVADIDDNDCGTVIKFASASAFGIQKAMFRIRKALNVRFVNFLDANIQPILDADITDLNNGNGAWAVGIDLATIEFPFSDAKDPDALALVDSVILNNNFNSDYFLMSGRFNWYQQVYNAGFRNLNDDERNQLATYNAHNMFFDIRDLDKTLTGKNTFAVDPSSYLFWNRVFSPSTEPTQIDGDIGPIWQFQLPDPFLRVMTPGGMRPLTYEVAYQKVCQGRDANTRHNYMHRYEVKLLGGLAAAPVGSAAETGIIKFSAQAGI